MYDFASKTDSAQWNNHCLSDCDSHWICQCKHERRLQIGDFFSLDCLTLLISVERTGGCSRDKQRIARSVHLKSRRKIRKEENENFQTFVLSDLKNCAYFFKP